MARHGGRYVARRAQPDRRGHALRPGLGLPPPVRVPALRGLLLSGDRVRDRARPRARRGGRAGAAQAAARLRAGADLQRALDPRPGLSRRGRALPRPGARRDGLRDGAAARAAALPAGLSRDVALNPKRAPCAFSYAGSGGLAPGALAPRSMPSRLRSSSTSGQWMPRPAPASSHRRRCSGAGMVQSRIPARAASRSSGRP